MCTPATSKSTVGKKSSGYKSNSANLNAFMIAKLPVELGIGDGGKVGYSILPTDCG